MMNIVNMTLKKKITTLKNLDQMRQMTLKEPKLDVEKSLDILYVVDAFVLGGQLEAGLSLQAFQRFPWHFLTS